ncbi:hypothetical protein [Spirosoma humi]
MSELTDDQLDGLFRKSAEEFDPPFDPAAWQDMQTRLDAHDGPAPGGGTPRWKNLLRWGLPLCLLLLTMVGLYLSRRNATSREASPGKLTSGLPVNTGTQPEAARIATKRPDAAKPQQTHSGSSPATSTGSSAQSVDLNRQSTELTKPAGEQPATTTASAKAQKQPDKFVNGSEETNTRATASETNAPTRAYGQKSNATKTGRKRTDLTSTVLAKRTVAGTNDGKRKEPRAGRIIPNRAAIGKERQAEWLNRSQNQLATNEVRVSSPMSRKRSLKTDVDKNKRPLAATNTNENFIQPMLDQAEPAGLPDVRELTIRPANWPKSLALTTRVVDVPPTATEPEEPATIVPKPPVERGLSVRLAISPDLSSIGLKNFARPGTNVGVLLEYRLAPRWSVQTGIIQSTKIYRATASDYTLNNYYKNAMYTIPQGADGQCRMLDIPLNVRYDFLLSPRADGRSPSRWFITGGVTSYFIEQETYVYKYTGYAHKPIPVYSEKGDNYGFSQVNLSAGYERALTKRLSWQIEPFMKIPLKQVGYLKLNLLSTGTFFSIRYKL